MFMRFAKVTVLYVVCCLPLCFASAGQENEDDEKVTTYLLPTGAAGAQPLQRQHDMTSSDIQAFLSECGLKEGMTVWDLGCGTGTLTALLARRVGPSGRVFALDGSAAQLAFARTQIEDAGLSNVTFIHHDLTQPYAVQEGQLGDMVMVRFVLMHMKDPKAVLGLMRDYVKPQGACILMEPNNSKNSVSEPIEGAQSFRDTLLEMGAQCGFRFSMGPDALEVLCEGLWDVKRSQEKEYRNDTTHTVSLWHTRLSEAEDKLLEMKLATPERIAQWYTMIEAIGLRQDGWYSTVILSYVYALKKS